MIHAEAIRLRHEIHQVIARFVETEIDTGFLFCKIASERPNGDRRRGLLQNAWLAHNTAQEWIWKVNMPDRQFDQIAAKIERLRLTLDRIS
jgi:hypothetical protein